MRIAVTVDPDIPVPPRHYGGIERVVHGLVEHLSSSGHEVVLFASPESTVSCTLAPLSAGPGAGATVTNAARLAREHRRRHFDVIHSFGRLAYLLPLFGRPVRKLMSYQRYITPRSVRWGHLLARGNLEFTAVSRHMIREVAALGHWHVVPNSVPVDRFEFVDQAEDDAPLVFLGRIEWIKGVHLAIDIARASQRSLIIAGNVPPEGQDYFATRVAPHLDDSRIRYVGAVDDEQKNTLLGGAAALLMPILWDEPFGIVMAEALACGTPVLGLARGSVPEIVTDGLNGFTAATAQDLAARVDRIPQLSRAACRAVAEERYSTARVADAYLKIYAGTHPPCA